MIIRDLDDDLQILKNGRVNDKFLKACREGDIKLVKELYNQYSNNIFKNKITYAFYKLGGINSSNVISLNPYYYNNSPLKEAFANNHFEVVEFLLKDKNFIKGFNKYNHGYKLSKGLSDSIELGNIELINLVLPLIKESAEEIHNSVHHGFKSACINGNISIIDYILNNNKFKEIIKTEEQNSFGFKNINYFEYLKKHGFSSACQSGNFETVKYFTESNNSDNYINANELLKADMVIVGSFELLEYFVFNLNIDKELFDIGNFEPSIHLGDFIETRQKIEQMFERRELFKSINKELEETPKQQQKTPKLKI